jgi:hypothetical protein
MHELDDGNHLAYCDYRYAYFNSKEQLVYVSASAGPGRGGAWGFEVAEVDLGEHGTAIQVRVFEDAFTAFTVIPQFFADLDTLVVQDLDEVVGLLVSMGAVDETARVALYQAEASPLEKAAAILRDHPAGIRDYHEARKLAEAIFRESGLEV